MSLVELERPRQGRHRIWTEQAVLDALRTAGQERGRWWTLREWEEARCRPSSSVVYAVIGSWSVAWTRAGFRPPARWGNRGPSRSWTDADLIAEVRLAAQGRYLSLRSYERSQRRVGGPCSTTVRKRLGPLWATVLERCGLPDRATPPSPEELVTALIRLWRTLGRVPSRNHWIHWTERPATLARVLRVLGSWDAFVDRARRDAEDLPEVRRVSSVRAHLLALPDAILTDRERRLAELFRTGATLAEAGAQLGVTRERVRQVALRAGTQRTRKSRGRRPSVDGASAMWSAEAVEVALRNWAARHDRLPSRDAWAQMSGVPSLQAIRTYYGSWRRAWNAIAPTLPQAYEAKRKGLSDAGSGAATGHDG